ncbi:hypothetical protein M405DRAFT_885521 [Rhizopogon salebrosus TDB-379]|nr:hypothetical protein M405DRAFT_885521 [Rhizopogon salebrosus TDB-379]
MPQNEKLDPEKHSDHDNERYPDSERDKDKSHKSKSSSKSKDLSHVPCKFFKVGACTAGSSCPFSHAVQEPGQHKDVCAWFVKGNCKFGHKCALAHILPGQNMSMDRKNKKSAQLAANAAGGGGPKDSAKSGRGVRKDAHAHHGSGGSSSTGNVRSGLLSGSTAPTRTLSASSRPPISMSLKATISPSAPAPPLNDTDFASFSLPDDTEKLSAAPLERRPTPPVQDDESDEERKSHTESKGEHHSHNEFEDYKSPSPPTLPVSMPSTRRSGLSHRPAESADLGPIGSPPRGSLPRTGLANGFSPATSPAAPAISSTLPAQSQSVFQSHDTKSSILDTKQRSGLAASLGTWKTELGPVPSQVVNRGESSIRGINYEAAVEDEDLEDFLPSSLNDLLTPEERSRRMSRTNSARPAQMQKNGLGLDPPFLTAHSQADGSRHHYSRSVPATSLLGDVKSIWAERTGGVPTSPDASHAFSLAVGTPSSFKSTSGFGGRSFTNEDANPSPSLLSPSNASAAFLPSLHQYYLNSKPGGIQRSTSGLGRPTGSPLQPPTPQNPPTPPRISSLGAHRPPFDEHASARPIPFGGEGEERPTAISPSIRALQAHAPGQSLPQGLAAGYSRIHALPMTMSPSSVAAFSPSSNNMYSLNQDWVGNPANQPDHFLAADAGNVPLSSSMAGLESMFSRLSYSAAATSRSPLNNPGLTHSPTQGSPLGIQRGTPGNRNWHAQGPLSPLSKPVVTADDDELFSMDG